mmetsp:Transcript_892/g.853  ORF Transcript_892/g.853 Transcript_892/m.853 type:complete len:192 (-) Transcript_892:13-588(-)
MLGDRRTFLGEASIRVLERKLGIQRDQTLIYQNSYSRNQFSSGYYNDSNLRGGHNNNPNSGVPVKRQPEAPAYQLGRQSYQQHKRVKTGEDYQGYSAPSTLYSGGPYPTAGYRGYPQGPNPFAPIAGPPHMIQNSYGLPVRSPNDNVSLRPPSASQYSSFDRNMDSQRDGGKLEEKREGKRSSKNRFSDFN